MNARGSVLPWVLAFIAAAGIGLVSFIGIGCAIGANACPFAKKKAVSAVNGETIWLETCALCHGVDGKGRTGPSVVSGDGAALAGSDLRSKIERGRPFQGMPRFKGTLSPAQIDAVMRYIDKLRGAA